MKLKDVYESAKTGLDAIQRAPIVDYETDLKCLRIQDISQSKNFDEWGYTETTLNDYKNFKLKKNDILIARTGATVGVSYFVKEDCEAVFNNGTIRLRLKDSVNSQFIYYLFQTKEFKQYIENVSCVSTQPNLKVENLLRFEIPNIDKTLQDKIVNVLSKYDDMIENNENRINILESIAEGLYKEWFVRFRFPGHEQALFKSGIPEDWEIMKFKDLAEIIYGYSFNSDLFTESQTDIPVVRIRDIPNGETKTYTSENCADKYIIKDNDILIGMDGIFHMCVWKNGKAYLNQRNLIVRSKNKNVSQLYLFYSLFPQIKYWEQAIAGTTVAHLGDKHINRINIIVPDDDILKMFNSIVEPIMKEICIIWKQNQIYKEQKSNLLPRLISNKIDMG